MKVLLQASINQNELIREHPGVTNSVADRTRSAAQNMQRSEEAGALDSERIQAPKGFKQLLDDGVNILKEAIAEKRKLITKERVIFGMLIATFIATSVLAVGFFSLSVAYIASLKIASAGVLVTAIFGAIFGNTGLTFALTFPQVHRMVSASSEIDQQHQEIQQLEQQIQFAKDILVKKADSIGQYLGQYTPDADVEAIQQKRLQDAKLQAQEGLIQFCKRVLDEKALLAESARKRESSLFAKIRPGIQKGVDAVRQQLKEGSASQEALLILRRKFAGALRHLAGAVQP